MRTKSKVLPAMMLTTLLLAVFLLGLGTVCSARQATRHHPFIVKIEPAGTLVKGLPALMQLEYSVHPDYKNMAGDTGSYSIIFLNPRDFKDTLSVTTYPVRYDKAFSHSTSFEIVLPEADTNFCLIRLSCGTVNWDEQKYFIASGNSVQFFQYFHMPPPLKYQSKSGPVSRGIDRDTLSQTDLQKLYRIVINIRDPKDRQFVENLVGVIPDSAVYNKKRGDYIIETTAENMLKFIDRNIELENITNRPGDPKLQRDQDSLPDDQSESDPSDHQGSLPNKYLPTAVDGYSLDSVASHHTS